MATSSSPVQLHPASGFRWKSWVVGGLVVEAGWLGLLHPLIPTTTKAWIVTFCLPLTIGIYCWAVIQLVLKLAEGGRPSLARRVLALLLVTSVGIAIFGAIFLAQYALPGQFSYGWSAR